MVHLPTVQALMDTDERRMLAELEIGRARDTLVRLRAAIDHAEDMLSAMAGGLGPETGDSMGNERYAQGTSQ